MKLINYKLGDLIEEINEKNINNLYDLKDLMGISHNKTFIHTKADMNGVKLDNYKLVKKNYFAYNFNTSRNGDKISIALNNTAKTFIISSSYKVFTIRNYLLLDKYYLYMFFNRSEFDRISRFWSWGSAREVLQIKDFFNFNILLPPLEIQQKYVNIYLSIQKKIELYEKSLSDLKLVCDGYVEQLRKKYPLEKIGKYIKRRNEKNKNFEVKRLIGVGINGFIEPKQEKDETNGHICYLVKQNDLVFAPPQIHNGSIDIWKHVETVKCSDAYISFYTNNKFLLPDYALLMLKTENFSKYSSFYRTGIREQLDFKQLSEYKISIPSLKIQQSIANIFNEYNKRKEYIEKLKMLSRELCPILIKGSIEETKRL